MRVKPTIILLILFLSFITSCSQDNNTYTLFEHPNYVFPYQLAEPDKSWKLPNTLVEISGLSFINNHRLACVQDEKGIIYIFNLKAGEVELEIDFGDDGDYEGIEIIENDAWILKSNGTLYKVTEYLKKAEPNVKKYTTALSGKNDTEGLAYDPVNKNLLIACKGEPFVDEKKGSGFKAIYSFNLETKQIDIQPFLLINLDTIKYYQNFNTMTRLGVEIQAFLDPSKGDVTFKPSGIAIQPVTGNVFILGSVGNLLLVLSSKGEMLAMIELRSKIFPQPEGICFSPDGTLYISNEGDGREGTILKFEPKDK
jgi:uncharacterized protein YjiK